MSSASLVTVKTTKPKEQIVAPNVYDLMSQSLWPNALHDAQVDYIQNFLVKLESGETIMARAAW